MNKKLRTIAMLLAMAAVPAAPVGATEPVDGIVKGAVYDLDRIDQQLQSLNVGSPAKVKRVQDALTLTAERLAGSSHQDHPSWIEANERLIALQADLDAKVDAAQAGQTAAPDAANQAGQTAAPAQAGQAAAPDAATQEAIDRFNRLVGHYNMDVPQLQKLTAEELDDPDVRHKWRTKMDFYETEMAAFEPYLSEPNVAAMANNVKGMVDYYNGMEAQVMAGLAALGDIDGRIAEMQARYDYANLPKRLDPPLEPKAIADWAAGIKSMQGQAEVDLVWLNQLLATTETRAFDAQNLVNGSIGQALPTAIERAVEGTRSQLLNPIGGLEDWVNRVVAIDPSDEHAVRNNLDGDSFDNLVAKVDDAVVRLETVAMVDEALGATPDAEIERQQVFFGEAHDRLMARHHEVVAGASMPEAKSEDPALLAAAEEVLSGDRYGFSWERMVVNYAPARKGEARAWFDGEEIAAAWYEWDEFQVATAEKTGDGYAVFFNELHFYHQADPSVPTGRWILHKRFEGASILLENIDG